MKAISGVANFYKLTGNARPRTIVMAGVGRGEEIPAVRRTWRRARLIGVEPLREHWRMINRTEGRAPDVRIRAALWSTAGEKLNFHLNWEPDQRATVYPLPVELPNEFRREVRTTTLDRIWDEYGPWRDGLLWLDVEGSEWETLRNASCLADAFRWINVELTFCPARNVPPWQQTDAVLTAAGFRLLAVHSAARNGRQADGIYVREADFEEMRARTTANGIRRKYQRLAERGRTPEAP